MGDDRLYRYESLFMTALTTLEPLLIIATPTSTLREICTNIHIDVEKMFRQTCRNSGIYLIPGSSSSHKDKWPLLVDDLY
jgi:hypothetical protein